jgi:transcription antitermination factor NusG
MPTLTLEPPVFPVSLFDSPGEGTWWTLHVKPRSEKTLARRCVARQSAFFLPQYCRVRRSGGRIKESFLPLFPGYVFLFGNEKDRINALESNLIVNLLRVPDQHELFEDLKRIHAVMNSGLTMNPAARLEPGTPVNIIDGPLAGLTGTVIRHKNRTTLMLKVSFLQQGATVEIENWMVEPTRFPTA